MQRVLLVGFGFMGGMHAQAWKGLSGAQLVGIVDPAQSGKPAAQMKTLGIDVPLFASLEEALTKVKPDVIDICTPTDTHAALAVKALETGHAVFCEKPMARSVAEAESMVAAAAKAGKPLMIGHCIRFWPEYQAFEAFLKSGKAGKLLSLNLTRRAARPTYSEGDWLNQEKRSGGAALDLHIHDSDWLTHLFGAPKAVTSRATIDASGPVHVFTDYDYEGFVARAEGGWNRPANWGFQMAFQATFENGAVEFDSAAKPATRVTIGSAEPTQLEVKEVAAGETKAGTGNLASLGGYANELAYFLERVNAGKPVEIATGADGLRSLRLAFAEIESAKSKKSVAL